MSKLPSVLLTICLLLIVQGCYEAELAELEKLRVENTELKAQIAPPPASLDQFFPPKAKAPVFLMAMYDMAMPMTAIFVNAMEGDMENVMPAFDKFKAAYESTSQMVPEWKDKFPTEPVDALGEALRKGDPNGIMAAGEKMGMVCSACHHANMVKVQQKYEWGDFSTITVEEPVSKQDMKYIQFMQMMDFSFTGIFVNLQEGQMDMAMKNFDGLKAQYGALKESCNACHETERKYYVDDEIMGMVDDLGDMLKSGKPDPDKMMGLAMGIGNESCHKCHMVHVGAQYAKANWGIAAGH